MSFSEPEQTLIDRYRAALIKLLPPGDGLAKWAASNVYNLVEGASIELARVHDRVLNLLEEADPSTADELLGEWETLVGLPDECAAADTPEDRRALVVARLRGIGGHAPDDYQAVAEALLGTDLVSLDYERYFPFTAGSEAGDALTNDEWAHVVEVLVETNGAPVARLECEFDRRKRAHSLFLYRWQTATSGIDDEFFGTLRDEADGYLLSEAG